jgi:predicted Mrr-cat superfamily restriction endonuclease
MVMDGWFVRAETAGQLKVFREHGFIAIRGGNDRGVVDQDLTGFDEDQVRAAVAHAGLRAPNYLPQLEALAIEMTPGDLVLTATTKRQKSNLVFVGRIHSDYRYRVDEDLRHARDVRWDRHLTRADVPPAILKRRPAVQRIRSDNLEALLANG